MPSSFPMVLRCVGNGLGPGGTSGDYTPWVCACGAEFSARIRYDGSGRYFDSCALCSLREEIECLG